LFLSETRNRLVERPLLKSRYRTFAIQRTHQEWPLRQNYTDRAGFWL